MENFELVKLHNGLTSLRCLEPRETFHPAIGPAAEAKILHVEQQRIVQRAQDLAEFDLWDVGLGAGANVLMAIDALQTQLTPPTRVHIHSFDKTTAPIRFALQNAEALEYPLPHKKLIEDLLSRGEVQVGPSITWHLHGEFTQSMRDLRLRSPDAIFYDPYSAKGNPEMWSLEIFERIYTQLDPHRLCLLSNYTASTYIRVTLLLAGFYVGRGCAVDKKVQTTLASNQRSSLSDPLDLEWLQKRVRVSHSAAPIRNIPHTIAPISEEDYQKLLAHPQFRS